MASLAPEDIDITQSRICTFNAADLTRAWLAVAIASGEDEARPVLNRTVLIEFYDKGARLVATDTYILLTCFVPWASAEMPRLTCTFSGTERAVLLHSDRVIGALMPMRVPMREEVES